MKFWKLILITAAVYLLSAARARPTAFRRSLGTTRRITARVPTAPTSTPKLRLTAQLPWRQRNAGIGLERLLILQA
jgi:hypothetical protein